MVQTTEAGIPVSLEDAARALAEGRTTSRALVEQCLDRIVSGNAAAGHPFLQLREDAARAEADLADRMRAQGMVPSRFLGVPVSVKDLFDITGEVTAAGSRVLADTPPATDDATTIARLRRAGFIVIGRTNMTEFAFSGLGLNPHHGTPLSPWDRATGRIAGGSSSGGAVSVAEGMALAALGTDTGGSCRIPAAFCGITGYKPTVGRLPSEGVVPLSQSLDSAGPLAPTVACCAALASIMAGGEAPAMRPALEPEGQLRLRIGVPQAMVLDDMDATVAEVFEGVLAALSKAGAQIVETPMASFTSIPDILAGGGPVAAEAHAWHRGLIERHRAAYDPRVVGRIERGAGLLAADYIDQMALRRRLIDAFSAEADEFDLLAFPTVSMVPPALAPLEEDDALYGATNLLVLRNSTTINLADGCAISVPVHRSGEAPVGLTLAMAGGADSRLLQRAAAVEAVLDAWRGVAAG
ncbi:amidase [Alkalilacustris brevis]|uniref:amidase n=1 Tax=Alkalilacustris brevis TaxID=2026338 RepID=UPI000E0DFDFE|nr:amidase [Alkalilacustris brevis]